MPASVQAPMSSSGAPITSSLATVEVLRLPAASVAPKWSPGSASSPTPVEACVHCWLPVAVRPLALP